MTKSGAARVRGQRRPRPPAWRPSRLIKMAYSGMSGVKSEVVMSEVKNDLMTESTEEVSGPFQFFQGGSGWCVCVFLASGYGWGTVMHEIPISSSHPLTSLPYPRTQ
jgi:hypothetical protein